MVVLRTVPLTGRALATASCSDVAGYRPNASAPSVPAPHGNPVRGSKTEPTGFATTSAATVMPAAAPAPSTTLAVPTPPLIEPARAPTPAPTHPRSNAAAAASAARKPKSADGRIRQ